MEYNGIKEEAASLTGKLTLEEKIGMIHGARLFETKGVERLGIPPLKMSDGPMGVRQEFEPDSWRAIGHSDDYVTYLPCNSAVAATWNRELAFDLGSVLGEETRGRGKDVILAPGINLKRSPLCGRNFEYFSEDPFLTGEMAVPVICGIQKWDVAACVKHFAVNNQETERLWVDVEIDEQVLREIYLPAFYDCLIKGDALTVMGAYNKLYGEHCCQSGYLLDKILREEWGYDGVVISDWGAVHDTYLAGNSSLDIEMSVTSDFDRYFMADPLKEAVEKGLVPEEKVDEKVCRILMLMMRLHMMDGKRKSGSYNTPEHREKALDIAREAVVLLKNEGNLLPLPGERIKKLLVIGDNAERIHSNGGGSAEIKALYEISPLMGIKMLLGGNVQVDFERGYRAEDAEKEQEAGELNWQADSLKPEEVHTAESTGEAAVNGVPEGMQAAEAMGYGTPEVPGAGKHGLAEQALEKAAQYDAVIFVGGLNHEQDREGNDRADMKLPYGQDELLEKLLKARPDTVVALIGGSPVEMGRWIDRAKAVLWSYYGGMETGRALAETVFGIVNPSGKLPETFYKDHMDCSAHCMGEFAQKERVSYGEGVFVGYRYNETFGVKPRFCFGHGLSYTGFAYSNGKTERWENRWKVQCDITNTGSREGAETVQIYRILREKEADACGEKMGKERPARELIGFEKVFLLPGETGSVAIEGDCCLDGYDVGIGSSVEDIRLTV